MGIRTLLFCLYCAGGMQFSQISLQAASLYSHSDHLYLIASHVMMRFKSKLSGRSIEVTAGDIAVEGGASLNVTGRATENGYGFGHINSNQHGVGGGHAGYGGGADTVYYNSGKTEFTCAFVVCHTLRIFQHLF